MRGGGGVAGSQPMSAAVPRYPITETDYPTEHKEMEVTRAWIGRIEGRLRSGTCGGRTGFSPSAPSGPSLSS